MSQSCACFLFLAKTNEKDNGGRVGLVVRALAFHQCGPGWISALGVICGLSLLVLYSATRGFPPGTPVFPSHQKPTFDLIWFDLEGHYENYWVTSNQCLPSLNKVIIIIIKTPVSGFPRALLSLSHARKRRALASRLTTFVGKIIRVGTSKWKVLPQHVDKWDSSLTRTCFPKSTNFDRFAFAFPQSWSHQFLWNLLLCTHDSTYDTLWEKPPLK